MILQTIWEVMVKNFKLIYRTKTSALVILLGPLFIVGVIGAAFSTSGLHSITIATYQYGPSEIVDDLIARLSVKDFQINRMETLESCISAVKRSEAHVCIEFPEQFDPSGNVSNEVKFHLDYSRINLAMVIWDALSQKVSKKSAEISAGIVQGMIGTIREAESGIKDSKSAVSKLASNGEEINETINDMIAQLQSFNTTSAFDEKQALSAITDAEGKVKQMKTQLDDFQLILDNTSDSIEAAKADSLSTINSISAYLENTTEVLEDFVSAAEVVCAVNPLPECAYISNYSASVESKIDEMGFLQGQLEDSKEQIESIGTAELDQADKEIEESYILLAETETTIGQMKTGLAGASATSRSLEEAKQNATRNAENMRDVLGESLKQVEGISGQLDKMAAEIGKTSSIESEKILQPIKTVLRPVTAEKGSFDFLFPSLLTLVVMFVSILLASTTVLTERESRAYFRNVIAPVPPYIFALGTLLSNLAIVLLQSFVLLGIASLMFDIQVFGDVPGLIFGLIVVSSVFILIGMIIGYSFSSEETATIASICLSIVLFMFSSLVLPIEKMAKEIAAVATASPFVLSEGVFRTILIFDAGIPWMKIGALAVFILVLSAFVIIAQRATLKNL
ncbi:MAG TPA: ABC transporter permease [Candidatus Nanoarchaeia archaeon]|nr:ABC transporter permease [Candidatus Nanoarchaeia archaeon]